MSIEQRLEDLTKAINELPSAIAQVMVNAANPAVTVEQKAEKAETPVKAEKAETSASDSTKGGSDNSESTGGEKAGRKTYVFDKTTKTGQIVEKGEELPEGDNFVRVGKTKWEQLCEKYNLDAATGEAVKEEPEDEDLDDTEEEGEQEEAGEESTDGEDDDMGLGLDDEEDEGSVDPAEVKKRMVRVMREVGREEALKLFKKIGARNFDEVAEDKLPKLYELAGKALGE